MLNERERERVPACGGRVKRPLKSRLKFFKVLSLGVFAVSTFLFFANDTLAATYYMRADGSATKANSEVTLGGSCIAANTAMSIATHDIATYLPGDTIYLCDTGGWFYDQLDVPSSGSVGNPITYTAAPGNSPVISGESFVTGWTDDGDGTYQKGSIPSQSADGVFEDGLPLLMASSGALADGNWYHDTTANILHYKPTSGVATDHAVGRLARVTPFAVSTPTVGYITVSYLTLRNSKRCLSHSSYYGNTNITLDHLAIKYCAIGIYTDGRNGNDNINTTITNNTIQNSGESIFAGSYANGTEKHTNLIIANNTITYGGLTGSNATEEWDSWKNTNTDEEGIGLQNLNNSFIYGNNISGDLDGGGIVMWTNSANTTSGNLIYNNYIHDIAGAGILGGSDGNNTFYSNTISYNIISNCGTNTGTHGGIRLNKTNQPSNKIYNNVISACDSNIHLYSTPNYYLIKNNISINPVNYHIDTDVAIGNNVLNNNLYYPNTGTLFDLNGTAYNFADWKTNSGQDTNSSTTDPLFVNSTGSYSTSTDFNLQLLSSSIDAGTDVSLTTDYAGNSIYGLPDIGGYEYQPPFTFATYDIPTTGSARLYSDGKYRMTTASTTSSTGNFSVTPLGGSYYTASTSQYMDITIDTWQTAGDKNKQWIATSTAGSSLTQATSTIYTIGDLAANSYYQFKLDGSASTTAITGATCVSGACLADSSGNLTFTYVGGYSTHIFGLEKDITAPSAFTLSSPTNNSSTSNSRPTLSWNTSSDSESGLNKYQLYIDNALDTDNISNSATSIIPTNALSSCGYHTWYVRAIDNAGNATDSSSHTLKMVCEGVILGSIGNFAPKPVYTVIPSADSSSSASAKQEEMKNLSITGSILTLEQKQEKIAEIKKELIKLINQLLFLLRQKLGTMQY